jgi:hypothetical protein
LSARNSFQADGVILKADQSNAQPIGVSSFFPKPPVGALYRNELYVARRTASQIASASAASFSLAADIKYHGPQVAAVPA